MIGKWWRKLLKLLRRQADDRRKSWPTLEQISAMPYFDEIKAPDIVVITTKDGARRAYEELVKETVVGFDTESKPTFVKGEKSTGPHVAQFATPKRAYIFILHDPGCRKIAGEIINLPALTKVGFGLHDDLVRIRLKLKVQPQSVLDLETLFTAKGHKKGVGVKIGVAITLNRQFKKSKKASTSNWGNLHLTDKQLLYAANDAYAAIQVYHALTGSD